MPLITTTRLGRTVRILAFEAPSESESLAELDRLALREAERSGIVGGCFAVINEHRSSPAWRGEFGNVFDLTPLQPALPDALRDRANHFFRQKPADRELFVIVRPLVGVPAAHVRVWNGKGAGVGGSLTRRG